MALIECPECGKKVSDRAASCPDCGYPIDEYIEEQNRTKEVILAASRAQMREKKVNERMPLYNEEMKFVICDNTVVFNKNDSICARIGCVLDTAREQSTQILVNLIKSGNDRPSKYLLVDFPEYGERLVNTFIEPIVRCGIALIGMFLDEDSERQEHFQDDIADVIDCYQCYEELRYVFADAFYEMEKMEVDLSDQRLRDRLEIGEPFRLIDSIYSPTIIGTIKTYISAEIINSITEGLTLNSVRKKTKNVEENFQMKIEEAALICDVKVYGALEKMIESVFYNTREFVIKYLFEDKNIYQEIYYPKKRVDFNKYSSYMKKATNTNANKVKLLMEFIENNPYYFKLYTVALNNVEFSVDDTKEIIRLIDFFDLTALVKNYLESEGNILVGLFEENADVENIVNEMHKSVAQYKGKNFSSVDEKERYIQEEKKYNKLLKNTSSSEAWYKKSEIELIRKELENVGVPEFEPWKTTYETIIKNIDTIEKEFKKNDTFEVVEEIIDACIKSSSSEIICNLLNVKDKPTKVLKEVSWMNGVLDDNEILILYGNNEQYNFTITSRNMYIGNVQNQALEQKFTLFDIDYTHCLMQKITEDTVYFAFIIGLNGKEYNLDSLISASVDSIVDNFSSSNTEILKNRARQVLDRTPKKELSSSYLAAQAERISWIMYLAERYEYKQGRWSFELGSRGYDWMINLGLEYVLAYTSSYCITDKALYLLHEGKTYKYDFAKNYMFVMSSSHLFGPSYYLVINEEKIVPIYERKDNIYQGLKWNVYPDLKWIAIVSDAYERTKNDNTQRNIIYCSHCNGLAKEVIGKKPRCSKCNKKVEDYGWHRWHIYRVKWDDLGGEHLQQLKNEVFQLINSVCNASIEDKEKNKTGQIKKFEQEESALETSGDSQDQKKMFCPYCGKQILRTAKFCNFCGKQNNYNK